MLVAARSGCLNCHSISGATSTGPTWKGLYGSLLTLADGTQVVVDEGYLRQSLTSERVPVAAYPIVMPAISELNDADIEALIEFIKETK
ncbi:MAG: cytochrome c [Dehalococcoidia bacterium]